MAVVGGLTVIVLFLQWRILKQSDETAQITNRAYINVSLEFETIQDSVIVTPVFENAGNTAAQTLKFTGLFDPYHVPGRAAPQIEIDNPTLNSLFLGPRAQFPIKGISTRLEKSTLSDIEAAKVNPLTMGAIIYRDAFGHPHLAKFCFIIWSWKPVTGSKPAYSQCAGVTNCTDKDCPDYQEWTAKLR